MSAPGWWRHGVRWAPFTLVLLAAPPAWAESPPDVPTLSFWGKVVLVAALIAVGVIAMRRSERGRER